MNIGMLWYDDDKKRSLEEKIDIAAKYYAKKYNKTVNMCIVNPLTMPVQVIIPGIEVKANRSILRGHLWLGVAGE